MTPRLRRDAPRHGRAVDPCRRPTRTPAQCALRYASASPCPDRLGRPAPAAGRAVHRGVLVLAAAELAVPMLGRGGRATSWHPRHMAERYGLFTMIVLGESLSPRRSACRRRSTPTRDLGDLTTVIVGGLLIVLLRCGGSTSTCRREYVPRSSATGLDAGGSVRLGLRALLRVRRDRRGRARACRSPSTRPANTPRSAMHRPAPGPPSPVRFLVAVRLTHRRYKAAGAGGSSYRARRRRSLPRRSPPNPCW